MHDNSPYQSKNLDLILLKEICERSGVRLEVSPYAFKHVSVVGMLLPDNDRAKNFDLDVKDLARDDIDMLRKTFKVFSDAGIPLHPEAQFAVYNLLPPVKSDFLLSGLDFYADDIDFPQTDIVVVNYLPRYGATPGHRFYHTGKGFNDLSGNLYKDVQATDKLTSVSHLHHGFNIWGDACYARGAKFAVTHGGVEDEVTTEQFEGHIKYKVLVDSYKNEREGAYARGNMGVAANRETVKDYIDQANRETELGTEIFYALD